MNIGSASRLDAPEKDSGSRALKRVMAVFSAHSFGNAVTLADRFLLVPLMLLLWGADLCGVWIIVRSVPAWLSVSEMGFASTSGNLMTNAIAAGNTELAGSIYLTTCWLIRLISGFGLLVAATICYFLPLSNILHCQVVSNKEFSIAILLSCAYTVSIFQTQILYALARSVERHAAVTFQINLTRVAEVALALLAIWLTGGVVATSMAYLLARWVGIVLMRRRLHQQISWCVSQGSVSRGLAKVMLRPAFGFAVVPIGQALQLQGVSMMLAVASSPTVVLSYNAMRTLARMPQMLAMTLGRTAWPEMSMAIARSEEARLRKIYLKTLGIGLLFGVCSVIALVMVGESFFRLWTVGKVRFEPVTFLLLVLGGSFSSFSMTQMSLLNAASRHESSSVVWTVLSIISVGACYLFGNSLNDFNASLTLLVCEVIVCVFILSASTMCIRELASQAGKRHAS